LDQGYLALLISSDLFKSYVDAVKTGSSIPHISGGQIGDFAFPMPPLNEQRAIAHILGTLDDKIELNRRMNETLEEMARALFKSWFVDFDPVRRKAEGRDPGLPKHLADLFPSRFVDSELGEIPEGWGTHQLTDLLTLDKGLSYKGQFLTDVGLPMVNLGCFLGNGRFSPSALKPYSGEHKPRHVVQPGDLVIANTDITQKRTVIGSPGIVPKLIGCSGGIFSHHVFAARFKEGCGEWRDFTFHLLLQPVFRERAMGFATGTTVLALPREAVLDLPSVVPPPALLCAFTKFSAECMGRQWQLHEEEATLASLRDALLPKLISGELRVKDADRFLAKVTA
jgi:type I restriction enzyme S subunit